MQDWVPSRFWFYARSRHLYLECWHPPNHRNLRRGKPQIAPNQGFLLPLFPGVLGGEASQGMPITYKYIYIYTHIYKHIYIYIYVSKYMLYCKYTYIHNTHCSSTGHASQDSTGAFAETLLCASESWDRWQLIWWVTLRSGWSSFEKDGSSQNGFILEVVNSLI